LAAAVADRLVTRLHGDLRARTTGSVFVVCKSSAEKPKNVRADYIIIIITLPYVSSTNRRHRRASQYSKARRRPVRTYANRPNVDLTLYARPPSPPTRP